MNEEQLKAEIARLTSTLTGDFMGDLEIQQEIYELKKQLNPRIVEHPEEDTSECLSCGS